MHAAGFILEVRDKSSNSIFCGDCNKMGQREDTNILTHKISDGGT
jgi:hypothetical protein